MLAGQAGYATWILWILIGVSYLLPSADARASVADGSHLSMDFCNNFEFLFNIFLKSKSIFFNADALKPQSARHKVARETVNPKAR